MNFTTAQQVLRQPYPDVSWPLNWAREWIYSDQPRLQKQAVKLLRELQRQFSAEPSIENWLTLALIETGERTEAEQRLSMRDPRQPQSEEHLCRYGRLFRERAEMVLPQKPHATVSDAARALALQHYHAACRKYAAAYDVRHGHYPLINLTELYLIKASYDSEKRSIYLQTCEQLTQDLLRTRAQWPVTLPDDDIWHAATEAHAYILLSKWNPAYGLLKAARSSTHWKPFHGDSIGCGLLRTLTAFKRLKRKIDARFLDPLRLLEHQLPTI